METLLDRSAPDSPQDTPAELAPLDSLPDFPPDTPPDAPPDTVGDVGNAPLIRHLTPEEYTNEPIPVGQAGMHFQCDGLLGPVQVVTGDERCAVLHGIVGDVLLIDEAKVTDVSEDFELDGIKLVWSEQEFPLVEEEILFGNQAAAGVPVRSRKSCPRVLVESSDTLYEGDFDPALGCMIPFMVEDVTYVTYISLSACTPWQTAPGDEVYLFVRFNEEDGKSYVLFPFFVEDGQVDSPCCPVPATDPEQFEQILMNMLAAETE
ncbi:MAG: hypothetical protein ABIK09_06980 [Pseudomonadota bacterium]